jgi:bifunctional non-homologous end joining protein LigD
MMKALPKIEPMALLEHATPFDDPNWLFEVKYDGLRAFAYVQGDDCKLVVDGDDAVDPRFRELARVLPGDLNVKNAVLDGELVVLDRVGKAQFGDLVGGRGEVLFAAFDLLWVNGQDLRELPLVERKEMLRFRVRHPSDRVMFVDYKEGAGTDLYARMCERDMEGIVAKPRYSQYLSGAGSGTTWVKVKNPAYSKAKGRAELFEPPPA